MAGAQGVARERLAGGGVSGTSRTCFDALPSGGRRVVTKTVQRVVRIEEIIYTFAVFQTQVKNIYLYAPPRSSREALSRSVHTMVTMAGGISWFTDMSASTRIKQPPLSVMG